MPGFKPFRYVANPIRIHAGGDVMARLGDEAARAGAKRAFIVCGQSVVNRTNLVDRVRGALGDRLAGVFDAVEAGSPIPSVQRGAMMARDSAADLIIAVGGGSAVVTARAIIILLAEGGAIHDHATKYPLGAPPVSPRLMQPKIPNFVVLTPTTAATRAGTAVIDPEVGHRLELFDPKTRPSALFWDSEALLTAPPSLFLSAAASCYSGVVGALQSGRGNDSLAEGDLRQALGLLQENMAEVNKQPGNGDVRQNLCAAAFLSNRAGDSGGGGGAMGVVSGLAHSLDTRYPECSHGAAYSILTAPGMRFNQHHNAAGQARLADILGVRQETMDQKQAAEAAASAVAKTYLSLGMESRLSEVGVTEEGIGLIAEDAITDFGLSRNVRPVQNAEELAELLRGIL